MDDAVLEIVIKARNEAREVMAEGKISMEMMQDALQKYNRAVAEGIPLQAALVQLQKEGIPTDAALIALTRNQTDAIKDQTTAKTANYAATLTGTGAVLGAIPVWLAVTAAIAAATAVLWPFVVLVGSAAVALISFTVGAAGFLAVAALVTGAFVAMGAGILLLGGGGGVGAAATLDRTTTALQNANEALVEFDQEHKRHLTILQQHQREQLEENIAKAQDAYNAALTRSQGPVGVLLAQLGAMKDAWAAQAAPIAALITQWVGGAIPAVTQLGGSLMDWFGARVPAVLAGLSKMIKDLTPDFQAFGQYFGAVMDKVGPQLQTVGEAMVRLGLGAVMGLLANLVRLSDWFLKELPTLGPVVKQIMDAIGNAIQWVIDHWAALSDFVVKNWQPTVANASKSLGELRDWWSKNGDTIKTFGSNVVDLMGKFNDIIAVWTTLYNAFSKVGLSPTAILNDINQVIAALKAAYGYADDLWNTIQKLKGSGSTAVRPPPGNYQAGGSGGVSNTTNTTINVQGNSSADPNAMARETTRQLRQVLTN